jgi:predicted dehydrogenase
MSLARNLKAVISGAGAAGCMHALTYRSAGVEVAAVYDPCLPKAQALANICGARVISTAEALFAIESDLASVCGPPAVHAEQATLACAGGARRAVFVEKPVATHAIDFERVAALGRCVPVLQWRAGRALRALRATVGSDMLGGSPNVCCDLAWGRDARYFVAGRGARSAWGAGVLLSVGIHAIDAVCFALDRPLERVSGALSFRANVEVETSAVMTMTFGGGGLCAVRATFESASDVTRLSFTGNGVAGIISGTEVDPTASPVTWLARDASARAALARLEEDCSGDVHPPLLVPFLHGAIRAVGRGAAPGECDRLPSVGSTRQAHAAVFSVYEQCLRAAG